jgi:hypothetical protein
MTGWPKFKSVNLGITMIVIPLQSELPPQRFTFDNSHPLISFVGTGSFKKEVISRLCFFLDSPVNSKDAARVARASLMQATTALDRVGRVLVW